MRAGIARVVKHAHVWKARFAAVDSASLSPASEADRELLEATCDGRLLWNQQIRNYQRDPGTYLPTSAINALIDRRSVPGTLAILSLLSIHCAFSWLISPAVALVLWIVTRPASLKVESRELDFSASNVTANSESPSVNCRGLLTEE